jgi:hypothetical protein
MVRAPLMKSLILTSDRFGFEPELTARLANLFPPAGARPVPAPDSLPTGPIIEQPRSVPTPG